ncbi:MAG: DUF5611 family protein [Thermoplasmata archaeon]
MQKYPVRPSHRANLAPEALEPVARGFFDAVRREGEGIVGQFGAISRIAVRSAGRELAVDVTMNPQVPPEVQAETIRRYNRFLEDATGYSSKERAKRLRKSGTAGTSKE